LLALILDGLYGAGGKSNQRLKSTQQWHRAAVLACSLLPGSSAEATLKIRSGRIGSMHRQRRLVLVLVLVLVLLLVVVVLLLLVVVLLHGHLRVGGGEPVRHHRACRG